MSPSSVRPSTSRIDCMRARLAEQALAGAQHDREDLQPQLVDEVVLQQGAHDPGAGRDDDVPVERCLEADDLVEQVAA